MLHLFGDESAFDTAVTYALVCVPADLQAQVERALVDVKQMFGDDAAARLHCKDLFHGDRRKRTPWAHLNTATVLEMANTVGNYLRGAGATFRLGSVDRDGIADEMTLIRPSKAIPTGTKQLVTFAYTVATAGLDVDPGLDNLRLWIDPDATMIDWGDRRRQAGRHPVTVEGGRPLVPEQAAGEKPPLVDVADILAYSAAHCLCKAVGPNTQRFGDVYRAFAPAAMQMEFHPQVFEQPPDVQKLK